MGTRPSYDSLHALELARLKERQRTRTVIESSEKRDLAAAIDTLEVGRIETAQPARWRRSVVNDRKLA
jgi:hypothetical protein